MKHIMIDLETLDTRASSVVLSVGAVLFDETQELDSLYSVLDADEQIKRGRTVSGSTLAWWANQSDNARAVFNIKNKDSLDTFASNFYSFVEPHGDVCIWGNGSDFDTAIMIDLWTRHQLPKMRGWKYKHHLCFRTFNRMTGCKELVVRQGTHHNALDDARFQAQCVLAAWAQGKGKML